ncbi:MAG: fatty acid hydroxylase, partial [Pseudomonadota bacterium]
MDGTLLDAITDAFGVVQQGVFEAWVQPLVFWLGFGNLLEDAYVATGWLLVGCLQIMILVALMGPLQRWRPFEPLRDRSAVWVDVIYTLIHRLGLFRLAMFFSVMPVLDGLFGQARVHGFDGIHLDALLAPW